MQTQSETDRGRRREQRVRLEIRLAKLEYRLRALCDRWSGATASSPRDHKRWAAAIRILEQRVARETELARWPAGHRFRSDGK